MLGVVERQRLARTVGSLDPRDLSEPEEPLALADPAIATTAAALSTAANDIARRRRLMGNEILWIKGSSDWRLGPGLPR